MTFRILLTALLVAGPLAGLAPLRAAVLEEIVAWVNGDIITKSQYDEEEQARLAEAYRRYSGQELDEYV
jgi:hypothetical protein